MDTRPITLPLAPRPAAVTALPLYIEMPSWFTTFAFVLSVGDSPTVVDAVVVGTRGHGILKRALLGSLSSYLAHHATVPVIITRSKFTAT